MKAVLVSLVLESRLVELRRTLEAPGLCGCVENLNEVVWGYRECGFSMKTPAGRKT